MTGRRPPSGQGNSWIVVDISEQARQAAEEAAAASRVALEIWLAETVLRACQEGVSVSGAQSETLFEQHISSKKTES